MHSVSVATGVLAKKKKKKIKFQHFNKSMTPSKLSYRTI